MRPFDPRILRVAPATRRPVATLAVVGVAQGVATIATAFALAALVVAVVRGSDLVGPALWTGALFAARGLLGAVSETVAARAGALVFVAHPTKVADDVTELEVLNTGVYMHGLFEDAAVLQALFGAGAPSLDAVFDQLAADVERAFAPGVLQGLIQ